jgi:triosephosphate isomerase
VRRRPLVAGNWKMFLDAEGAAALARDVVRKAGRFHHCDVAVLPGFPLIPAVGRVLEGTAVGLGAQDISAEIEGAFTGEVSAKMLKSLGVTHVAVGHSERREHHLESDDLVRRKVGRALDAGLTPIVCIGERLAEREGGQTFHRIETQVKVGLDGLGAEAVARLVIAYEPVWAIGTGKTATPAQAEEVHEYIRRLVGSMVGPDVAAGLRILYGGSVKADNAVALMAEKDVDGALVGGASLSADAFAAIVEAAR